MKLTVDDVAAMNIPDKDKVWLFCQENVLTTEIKAKWRETIVTRAIKTALTIYNEPNYVRWAENWLNGDDRSARTAHVAYTAAHAAAHAAADAAAYTAAYTAADAAFAAADAAAYTATYAAAYAAAHAAAYATHAVHAVHAAAYAAHAAVEYKQQVADLMALLDK